MNAQDCLLPAWQGQPMIHEPRISSIGQLDKFPENLHVVSIRHEGCKGRLPDYEDAVAIGKVNRLKRLCFPNYRFLYGSCNQVCPKDSRESSGLEVMVNDYGALKRLSAGSGVCVMIGRILVKTFEEHPDAE